MDRLIKAGDNFRYSSFQYESPENPVKIIENENYILAAEKYQSGIRCFWACNSSRDLLDGINELSNEIAGCEIMLEFIPPEFIEDMKKDNFSISSEWIDFWITNLKNLNWNIPKTVQIRTLNRSEVQAAAEVTKSCRGVSRGFYGEEPEFINEWLDNNTNEIFAAVKDEIIVGICMMSIYQGRKGRVAWLRELAVTPKYQYQGIGRSLAVAGLEWGKNNGAELSFLATDAENLHSINLYKRLGYVPNEGRGQINISKQLK